MPAYALAECIGALTAVSQLQETVAAENTARDALITLRRNAQDWKNVLLRGRDEVESQKLLLRFNQQAKNYAELLVLLRQQLTKSNLYLTQVDILEKEQSILFAGYRSALARYGVLSLEAAATADRAVQGADVLSFRTLESIISSLAVNNKDHFQKLRQAIMECK